MEAWTASARLSTRVADQGERGRILWRSRRRPCADLGGSLKDLARSGYTLLTGYNYNTGYQNGGGSKPFRELIDKSHRTFGQFAKYSPLPYVPVVTIGWDLRPWEQGKLPPEKMSTWHPDRSPELVEEFVRIGRALAGRAPRQSNCAAIVASVCLEREWGRRLSRRRRKPTARIFECRAVAPCAAHRVSRDY